VREPRATLWVFELTAGEDCEGRQLQGDLVAEEQGNAAPERAPRPAAAPAEPPAAPGANAAAAAAKPAVTAAEPAVTAAKPAATAGGDAAAQVAEPSPAPATQPPVVAHAEAVPPAAESAAARSEPEPGQTRQGATNLAGAAPAAEPQTAAPAQPAEQPATAEPKIAAPAQVAEQTATAQSQLPAPAQAAEQPATAEPQTVARAEPAEQAVIEAAPAATPQSPAKPSTVDGKVESGPQGGLIITFATNSSYFPSGAAARLRGLLAGVNGDKKYQVTLQVAVSGTTQVVGAKSADEAARYNRWLADRRVERVQAWLVKNAGAQALSIKPEYVANDDSRRLTVRLAPTG
jgi:hypothetical protein